MDDVCVTHPAWEPEVNNVDPFHLRVPEGNAVGSGEELTRVLRAPKDRSSWRLRPQTGCTSVGCQVQRTTEVSMCWSCGHVYCWDCMTDGSGAHACIPTRHKRAFPEAVPVVADPGVAHLEGSRKKRRADRGEEGESRRAIEEAAALACRKLKEAAAESARVAAKAVKAEEGKKARRIAREARHLKLQYSCYAHYLGEIGKYKDYLELSRSGYTPAPTRLWRTAGEGRFLTTWNDAGKACRMWWVRPDYSEESIVRRVVADEDRSAMLLATPSPVRVPQGLQEGVGAVPGRRLDGEEELESESSDPDQGRSSSDGGRVRGSDADTVGKLSDGSMSDGDGGRVGFAKQAVPGEFIGAGALLLDYSLKETITAWEASLVRKLRRKSLEEAKVAGGVRAQKVAAAVVVKAGPITNLVEGRRGADSRLRKRRIEVLGEGDQGVKEGKKPLTNKQRKLACRSKRREEQRSRGLDLGYMADSER